MAKLAVVQDKLAKQGRLGPVARLLPTTAATTLRKDREPPLVIDGPFAETKEQLLGFYVVDCADLEEALDDRARPRRGQSRAAPTRSGRCRLFHARRPPSVEPRRDRPRLDRRGADLGASPGGRRAAALFPRSRHRRGGLPGGLPARAEDLAAERAAARSRRLADLRRPQRRHRRACARRAKQAAAARRGRDLRPRRRRERARRAARRRALPRRHPAAAVHLLPSRAAGDAADRAGAAHRLAACRSSRSRAPSWSARAAMEQRITRAKARIAEAERAVRDAGRGRARRAARRRGGDDLPGVQRGLFGERRRGRRPARRCARRRSGWRACCCGCSRPSRRSWG